MTSDTLKEIQLEGEASIYKAYELGYREATEGKEAYEKGLNDAWECARKLYTKIPCKDEVKLFKTSNYTEILADFSASEAIAKVEEWENQKVEVTEENFRALCEALMAVSEAECCSYNHDEAFDMAEHYMEQIKENK